MKKAFSKSASRALSPVVFAILLFIELIAGTSSAPSGNLPPMQENMQTIVYIVPKGYCYHATKKCWTLSKSKIINEVTKQEAISMDRKPCSVCYGGKKKKKHTH